MSEKLERGNVRVVAIIPAKGQSERLPNKNKLIVNGKPMLYWGIKACKDSKYKIDVWVSSDNDEILDIAKIYGAEPYKRKPELSGSCVFKQEVIRDVFSYFHREHIYDKIPDIVISLQPNSPQIKGEHLDKGIDALIDNDRNEIFSVNSNLMQNGAFRIMKSSYVFQLDLSTYCDVVVCDLVDVHDKEDLEKIEKTCRLQIT